VTHQEVPAHGPNPLHIAAWIFVPLAIVVATVLVLRTAFMSSVNPPGSPVTLFEVANGKTTRDICTDLQKAGLIKYDWAFCFLARLKGADTNISAGEYELSPSMPPLEILNKLARHEVFERKVTIKEGSSLKEIGPLLEAAGIVTAEEFNKELSSSELLSRLGIENNSFEGYLFPETYHFSRPITAYKVVMTMFEQGEKRWSPEFSDQLEILGMNRHKLLTMASIVETESGNVQEQPLISAVFHNRLKVGMKLQADPTVIYGLPDFDGNLTRDDLQSPSPYNTYVNYGLPPGPICNPGLSAIKAALYPADTPYLYFVADGNGNHIFSKTLEEHNQAVNFYQRRRSK
jgi:UPF0755 protein